MVGITAAIAVFAIAVILLIVTVTNNLSNENSLSNRTEDISNLTDTPYLR